MKYILYEVTTRSGVKAYPFMFDVILVHADMNDSLKHALFRHFDGDVEVKPVAAGFYNPITGECYGRSETMDLGTHPNTSDTVRMAQYGALLDKPLPIPTQLQAIQQAHLEKLQTRLRDHTLAPCLDCGGKVGHRRGCGNQK